MVHCDNIKSTSQALLTTYMQSAVQHGEKEGKLFLIVCTVFHDYDNNVRSGDYHIKRLAACLVVGPLPSGFFAVQSCYILLHCTGLVCFSQALYRYRCTCATV